METLTIVKVGGGILENPSDMEVFLNQFAAIDGKKILVHGGGREATRMMEKLGIPAKMVEGRRITDAQTLDIVTMVYGGLINKRTVVALQVIGCNAIGLTGADAGLIIANKRSVKEIDYGFVGDVERVNRTIFMQLVESGLTPVLAPLTFDINGSMLNTNADTIASEVAIALSGTYEVSLVFCFEKTGVLSNPNDENSLIKDIDLKTFTELKGKGIITDGMIPKLDSCFNALKKGVTEVWITNAKAVNSKQGTKLII
ncbi:MAG: acetylglutamate kinase [Bacteroidales bacterium]|nr:MAG: acetylglutamate kinase [Bacteroidales bacterium]